MDKIKLETLINENKTAKEIAEELSTKVSTLHYWLKKYNLKTNQHNRKTSIIWTISTSALTVIVQNSSSLAEILRELGYNNHLNSALYRPLKKRIKENNIDISHITLGLRSNKGRIFTNTTRKHTKTSVLEILKLPKILKQGIRQKLITFNIIPHETCAICTLPRIWNGKKLTLQLDHRDGNPKNNSPSNLRFVCPNCHTQTETFCKGNRKNKPKPKCLDCSKIITGKYTRCQDCANKNVDNSSQYRFNPSKEELIKLVCKDKITFVALGKQFNVSDNAVRKRCIKFGICPKTRKVLP